MRTAVAFFIFNRPETTARVFAEIARARPARLLIIADGPRADRPDEAALCAATRAVVERVDWDCQVLTNFSEVNLGCKLRVSSGIDWVFSQEEEAIILEDDCLPHPSFFPFCEEMLERYRHDERVMAISGNNFQQGRTRTPFSYFFSRYLHIWGWASWRRAWQRYDLAMSKWDALRQTRWLEDLLGNKTYAQYWHSTFDNVRNGQTDTWDYQLLFACWVHDGLAITPEVNLVTNIGFGVGSTHTEVVDNAVANLPLGEMRFPLRHPSSVMPQREADEFESKTLYAAKGGTFYARARRRLAGVVPALRSQRG